MASVKRIDRMATKTASPDHHRHPDPKHKIKARPFVERGRCMALKLGDKAARRPPETARNKIGVSAALTLCNSLLPKLRRARYTTAFAPRAMGAIFENE